MSDVSQSEVRFLHTLNNTEIDAVSEALTAYFGRYGVPNRDILRMRLGLEEALMHYQLRFGSDTEMQINARRRFGRVNFEIRVRGDAYNPFAENKEDELLQRMLNGLDLAPAWSYRNGVNSIHYSAPVKMTLSSLQQILLAIVLGCILGWGAAQLPETALTTLNDGILTPIFDTMMGLLSAFACLLIFVAMVNSITGMGDISTLSKIGGKMISRFMLWQFGGIAVCVPLMVLLFRTVNDSGGGLDVSVLVKLVLDVIPSSVVTPFVEGNTLQIIFVAACCGVALLALGTKTAMITEFISQAEYMVKMILDAVLRLMPIVVFISLFQMVASGTLLTMGGVLKSPLVAAVFCLLYFGIRLAVLCVRTKINPMKMMKKLVPITLLAFSTSSQAACYSKSIDTLEKEFGVSPQMSTLGVTLGQAVYGPGAAIGMAAMCLCMAEVYQVPVNVSWLVTLGLMSVIMSIASPPIPGGNITCYAILCRQLGIPMEAVALCIALDVVHDRLQTTVDTINLHLEVTALACNMKMVKREVLEDGT